MQTATKAGMPPELIPQRHPPSQSNPWQHGGFPEKCRVDLVAGQFWKYRGQAASWDSLRHWWLPLPSRFIMAMDGSSNADEVDRPEPQV